MLKQVFFYVQKYTPKATFYNVKSMNGLFFSTNEKEVVEKNKKKKSPVSSKCANRASPQNNLWL